MEQKVKRFRRSVFLCLLMVLGHVCAMPQDSGYQSYLKGRVVNESGRAESGARIIFYNAREFGRLSCWVRDNQVSSDGVGQFLHQEYCTVEKRQVFLFTEASTGFVGAEFPMAAPFWPELRKSDPRFAGLKVDLHGTRTVDLGDIPVQVWYNLVECLVLDRKGRFYYKSEDDWANFALIVRDAKGVAVGSLALSTFAIQNNVRVDRGSVRLALPEGTWTLELLRDLDEFEQSGKTRHSLATTTVTVKKSDVCLQARLVVG